jgi:hypothetical protein
MGKRSTGWRRLATNSIKRDRRSQRSRNALMSILLNVGSKRSTLNVQRRTKHAS